jgi:hypothetical protein
MAYRMVNKINEEWCFVDDNGNYVGDVGPRGERLGSGPIFLTAAEIASPTAAILADRTAAYIGPAPDYIRYRSDGVSLIDDSLATSLLSGELQQFNRFAGGAIAEEINATSVSAALSDRPCLYYGYIVTTALSAAAITLYDNASAASGTIIEVIPASQPLGEYLSAVGIPLTNGLYASFAGTGAIFVPIIRTVV